MKLMRWMVILLFQVAASAGGMIFIYAGFDEERWWVVLLAFVSTISVAYLVVVFGYLHQKYATRFWSGPYHFGLSRFWTNFTNVIGFAGVIAAIGLMMAYFLWAQNALSFIGLILTTSLLVLYVKTMKLSFLLNIEQD